MYEIFPVFVNITNEMHGVNNL